MIKKWVKLLPYCLVMKFCRSMNSNWGKLNTGGKEYDVRYFQIDEGEIITFAPELQKIFDDRRKQKKEEKLDKKVRKMRKMLNSDYDLKESLKAEFKEEEEEKEEARRCGY